MDQLSKIVNIDCTETPIVDTNQPDRETGGNRFVVKLPGGQILVDTAEYTGLTCVARADYEKVHQTDIDGLYDIYWENGEKFNIYNQQLGGDLYGLVQMRDGNNGEQFTGDIIGIGTDANGNDTVTVEVNKAFLKDLNKCNLSDQGGIINLGNQLFYYDSWELKCTVDQATGEETYQYTFHLSDATKNQLRITNDRIDKVATIGQSVLYQGVPYYMNQMNEWVRTFAQKFNDIVTDGVNTEGNPGTMMFTGDMATDDSQYQFTERYDLGGDFVITDDMDSYYKLTAGNFNVLEAMIANPTLLATRKDAADGIEQNDLLEDLLKLSTDKDVMTFRGASASEFLQCILSDIALNANRANTFSQNYSDIGKVIDNQRISISGVDEDEEAVNLVKYQNGYSLASKMIQTLTEVYDRLILETGI